MAKDFSLDDFRRQLDQVEIMGSKALPGFSGTISGAEELAVARIRRMIDAMTEDERSSPDLIDAVRRSGIAKSSGTQPQEVESFLAQFQQVRALMRRM